MKNWVLILSLGLMCFNLGCGRGANGAKSPSSSAQKILVFGDPNDLVTGTQKNPTSFLTAPASNWSNSKLRGLFVFTEASPADSGDGGDPTEDGDPAPIGEDDPPNFGMFPLSNGEYSFDNPDYPLGFRFHLDGNVLNLVSIYENNTAAHVMMVVDHPATALHYSISPDGKYFSILASIKLKTYRRALVAAYFSIEPSMDNDVTPITTNPLYNLLFSAGKLIGWKKTAPVNLNICGSESQKIAAEIQQAGGEWQTALGAGLDINTPVLNTYPPFSDVNTHCIYTPSKYLMKVANEAWVLGVTLVADGQVGTVSPIREIRTGSIIIFGASINDIASRYGASAAEKSSLTHSTVLHEMGHWLGLAHKFDGTLSIMSYEFESQLQTYDVNVIHELYPAPVVLPTFAGEANAIYFQSSPGDWVGKGVTRSIDLSTGTYSALSSQSAIQLNFSSPSEYWTLVFGKPGGVLTVGSYNLVSRFGAAPDVAMLSVSGNGADCNQTHGSIEVKSLTYDAATNKITSFYAEYIQYCESIAAPLRGVVKYNAP